MNVLFLAVGGTRRAAVIAEAEQVVARGGTAIVLVGAAARWRKSPLPKGAEMVELSRLERGRRDALTHLLVSRVPLFALRVCLPGPLRGVRKRAQAAYRRRVVSPVERRAASVNRRNRAGARERAVAHGLVRDRSVDIVVIGDPQSMVVAAEQLDAIERAGARLAYSGVLEWLVDADGRERPLAGHVEG